MSDDEGPLSSGAEKLPDAELPPSSDDVLTPRSSVVPPTSDFRVETMQSAIDATQERPPYVPPLEPDPFPLVPSDPPSAAAGEKLDTFVAVLAANADRIAAGQNRFLADFGEALANAGDEDDERDAEQTRLLKIISRDLRVLIAVALGLLALGLWLGGRQSAGREAIPHRSGREPVEHRTGREPVIVAPP